MAITAFHEKKLWRRIYDKRVLTEDGAYAEDNVPTDYAGSELEIEFNQIMIFGDETGSFDQFTIMDFDDLLDMDKKTGVGVTYEIIEGQEITIPPSAEPDSSTLTVNWYTQTYDSNFPSVSGSKMEAMYLESLIQREILDEDGQLIAP